MRSLVTRWAGNLDACAMYLQPGLRVLVLTDLVWFSVCCAKLVCASDANDRSHKSLVVSPGNPAIAVRYDPCGELRKRLIIQAGT